ncbi:MAG: restriction endonuclease subunit S [Ruminococcus sp.]|nr:restriction endonuclease subunit S [Ruminococcus sp.]
MVRLDTLFHLTSGNDLELCYLTENDEGIAFVSRTAKNNGISARVDIIPNIKPFKAGTISVSLGGSVLETFIHEEEFYTGYHIKVLTPIEYMSIEEMQYYCLCIKANKFKYSFGRQANKTIGSLMVPDRNEIPKWVNNKRNIEIKDIPDYFLSEGYERACWFLDNINHEKFEKKYSKSVISEKINLNKSNWEYFDLIGKNGLFEIDHGKRLKTLNRIEGDIPLITAGKYNQGIATYISENNNMKLFDHCITIDMFGNSFYHSEQFYCDDNIVTLRSKSEISDYVGMFIATVINMEQFRYSFGRQYRMTKYSKTQKILLPSLNGVPNYEFMEKYIKYLNYSVAI